MIKKKKKVLKDPSKMNTMELINLAKEEMEGFFIERGDHIEGLFLALLSSTNIFYLGPPGTAKSLMVRELAKRIIVDGNPVHDSNTQHYFERLMTRYSTPEEIIGVMKAEKCIKEAIHEYNTEFKLPNATIAFLDEIFKANSSILNTLLTALNEGFIHNGNKPQKVPLELTIGASNEIPQEEELKPFYDRFRLRYLCPYIKDHSNLEKLILLNSSSMKREGVFELDAIKELRESIQKNISFDERSMSSYLKVLCDLDNESLRPSDRTAKEAISILKASAAMNGHAEIQDADMEVLEHIFWDDPKDREKIRQIIYNVVNPIGNEIIDIYEAVRKTYNEFIIKYRKRDDEGEGGLQKLIAETVKGVKQNYEKTSELIETLRKEKKPTGKYEKMLESMLIMQSKLKTDYLGV